MTGKGALKWAGIVMGLVVTVAVYSLINGVHAGPLGNERLALALGDQPGSWSGPFVTCAARTGRTSAGKLYNRVCYTVQIEGICAAGTGELRSTVYVRVTGSGYRVIARVYSIAAPCESVA
jgi:hypothetical protein